MNRAELITELKNLLDRGDLERVRVLAMSEYASHRDVAERALAARLRLIQDEKPAVAPAPVIELPLPKLVALKPGHYTVVMDDGHLTFRVERQDEKAKFAPGKILVSRLTGPDNTSDYQAVAFGREEGGVNVWNKFRGQERLEKALAILTHDPQAAGLGYAKQSGRCYICGRLLTDPTSIIEGVGPICRDRSYSV